jgi:hypothetical protein
MRRGDKLSEMSIKGRNLCIDRHGNEAENEQEKKRWSV